MASFGAPDFSASLPGNPPRLPGRALLFDELQFQALQWLFPRYFHGSDGYDSSGPAKAISWTFFPRGWEQLRRLASPDDVVGTAEIGFVLDAEDELDSTQAST